MTLRHHRAAAGWVLLGGIGGAGASAVGARILWGLGGSTALSDRFPWGVWIGLDVLCGVGLAAGGSTVAVLVTLLRRECYRPLLRPALLSAFLGNLMVVASLLCDLGQPHRIWQPLLMGNPRSAMFMLCCCVPLYTALLLLELSPALHRRRRPARAIEAVLPPLVVATAVLSAMHQMLLGAIYLIAPGKVHPIWYTPLLPLLFLISAVAAGLAAVILESFASHRFLAAPLHWGAVVRLGGHLRWLLAGTLVLRVLDLVDRRVVVHADLQGMLLLLELAAGTLAPAVLLSLPSSRHKGTALLPAALLAAAGFVLNRLNVSYFGMRGHEAYLPAWPEWAISVFILGSGIAVFAWVARRLPIFGPESEAGPVAASGVGAGPASPGGAPGTAYPEDASCPGAGRPASPGGLGGAPSAAGSPHGAVPAAGNAERRQPGPRDAGTPAEASTGPAQAWPSRASAPHGEADSPGARTNADRRSPSGTSLLAGLLLFLLCCAALSRTFDRVPATMATAVDPGGEPPAGPGTHHTHRGAAPHAAPQDGPGPQRRPAAIAFARGQLSPGVVRFDHSAHEAAGRMACGECHPRLFGMVRTASAPAGGATIEVMRRCARCHAGRTAFAVQDDCAVCHATRVSQPAGTRTRRPTPPDRALAQATDSPGVVTFSHDRHIDTGARCSTCHPRRFTMRPPAAGGHMQRIRRGEECGACHDGRTSFTAARDCGLCHAAQAAAPPRPVSTAQLPAPREMLLDRETAPAPVLFSHARHLRVAGGSCTGCHPALFRMGRSGSLRMAQMRAGSQCGSCHNGTRAFTVARDCALCHAPPRPLPAAPVLPEQRRRRADHAYARGSGSPGTVTFSHERHLAAAGSQCTDCHPALFPLARPTATHPGVSMAQMFEGKQCGHCHSGTRAFTAAKDCALCHRAEP